MTVTCGFCEKENKERDELLKRAIEVIEDILNEGSEGHLDDNGNHYPWTKLLLTNEVEKRARTLLASMGGDKE